MKHTPSDRVYTSRLIYCRALLQITGLARKVRNHEEDANSAYDQALGVAVFVACLAGLPDLKQDMMNTYNELVTLRFKEHRCCSE